MSGWRKPAGRNAAETRAISDAVRANKVQSAVGFNYRNVPAVAMAKQLIADGRLGRINHVCIRLLADYAAHPEGALTWRFMSEWSGSGSSATWPATVSTSVDISWAT